MERTVVSQLFRIGDAISCGLDDWIGKLRLQSSGVSLGQEVRVVGSPIVSVAAGSSIRIGSRVVLCSRSAWTALGVMHPVVLRTLRPGALLSIGDDTGISGGSLCAAMSVTIGARCLLGADVVVTDTDFHAINPENRRYNTDAAAIACKPVVIGDDVFLGARAVILKGATIGNGAVIGAMAVVCSDIPAHAIAVGNPARVVGTTGGAAPAP